MGHGRHADAETVVQWEAVPRDEMRALLWGDCVGAMEVDVIGILCFFFCGEGEVLRGCVCVGVCVVKLT